MDLRASCGDYNNVLSDSVERETEGVQYVGVKAFPEGIGYTRGGIFSRAPRERLRARIT